MMKEFMEDKKNDKIVTAVALGDFDGMHRAHNIVVTGADRVVIYCVHNHFTLLQRSLFEKRYPNAVFADFEEIRNMSGEQFIENVLIDHFHAGMVLCGFNFHFGRDAAWSAMNMRQYLEKMGIWVRILEPQMYKGEPISSTRIRRAVKEGNMEEAADMLGYPFTFENVVVSGDRRGRTIGFPTVNQYYPESLVQPKFGVYESRTVVDGKEYKSFTNLGIRPTWRLEKPMAETHIFDFSGDLYGKTVEVRLLRYLREEKIFASVEELKEQLNYDKSSIV